MAKILIADDEAGWRELLLYELQVEGYEVLTAENGFRALQILGDEKVDLVITDICMAGMDGVDFIETFKKKNPEQKVLFITGYAVEEKLKKAQKLGAVPYLEKPFNMDDLFSTVRKIL